MKSKPKKEITTKDVLLYEAMHPNWDKPKKDKVKEAYNKGFEKGVNSYKHR
jgi:hypothetical protein